MTKEGFLITLGVITAVSPFIGIPSSWLSYLLPVLGILAAITAVLMLRARKAKTEQPSLFHEASPAA